MGYWRIFYGAAFVIGAAAVVGGAGVGAALVAGIGLCAFVESQFDRISKPW